MAKTTKTYKELNEATVKNFNVKDKDEVVGVLLSGAVNNFSPTSVFVLEKLTGLDLGSKEKLFDYLKANIDLDEDDIGLFGLLALAESAVTKSIDENLVNDIAESLSRNGK